MNITEFITRLKAYVESHTPNYQDGDAETLLEVLFNVYTEFNGFDNQIIYPVCTLCRDHEKTGLQEGIKVVIRLAWEVNIT